MKLDLPEDLRAFVSESLRWLHDPTVYEEFAERPHGRSVDQSNIKWDDKDLQAIIRAGRS